nr:conserved hypothetical protein [Hymenolepis microstoma]
MLYSLEASLLSTATVVFNWATNTFNCGILNYIFTVTANNTIKLTQTSMPSAILAAVNENLFQGGSRRLKVYNWLPVELQTGSGVSHNVAILTGVTIIISFLLLVLPLTVIIVSCCCHCRFKAKENANINQSQRKDTHQEAYFLEKIHAQALEAIKISDKSADCFNLCHIIVFAVTFLLIVALAASIAVLFIAGFMVTDILTEDTVKTPPTSFTSDNFTIFTGVTFIFSQFLDFLNTGISGGKISTEVLLKDINSTFTNILELKVSTAVDKLLVEYGVKPLMHAGETLQGDLKVLQTNMDYIRLHNQQVSQDISQLVGKFNTIYNLVGPELDKVCNRSMGPEIEVLCGSLKSRAPTLLLQFNASAIKVDPPAVLNFIFNELGVDLTKILQQFSEFTVQIEEVKNEVLTKLSSFLDLNSMLAPLIRIWDALSNATVSISGNLTKITEYISANIGRSRALASVLIYTPLTLILAFLVANSVIATLDALEAKKTAIFYRSNTDSYDSSHVCSNRGNLVYATILAVFLIILCILIIILLPTVTMFASDGCVYLVEQQGVAQTDCVLNSFVENEIWPTIVAEIEGTLQPSVRDFLVLSSPQNIVNASTVICGESIHTKNLNGLLKAVGWNTFISIPKVFANADVQQKIQEGELTLKQEILNQNLGSLIPSNSDQIIKTTQNLTQYFDTINYQPSIDELSPSKLPHIELANYANDLETLILKMQNLGLQTSDILQRCVNLIRDDLITLQQVSKTASKLREAFMEVQSRRNLTTGINGLVAGIEEVKKTFSNDSTILAPITPIYWNLIDSFKVDLESGLNPVIQSFLHSILPCSKVYTAADALLQMVCRQNGVLSRVFVWLYILAITTTIAVVLFFSTFLLGFIQTHHFRRLKYASQIFSPSKNSSTDRYIPYPSPSCRNTIVGSHTFKKQIHSPNELKRQQEQPRYRLTAPIPAAYVDRRDCNPLRAFQPASEVVTQDGVSEISESSLYEDPAYHPVPAPRSRRQNLIPETELQSEVLNSHLEQKPPNPENDES